MKTIYTADWNNNEESINNRYSFEDKSLTEVIDQLISIDDECVWKVYVNTSAGKDVVAEIINGQYTIY